MVYILAIALLTVYFMIGIFLAKWSFLGDGADDHEQLYIALTWPIWIVLSVFVFFGGYIVGIWRAIKKGRR